MLEYNKPEFQKAKERKSKTEHASDLGPRSSRKPARFRKAKLESIRKLLLLLRKQREDLRKAFACHLKPEIFLKACGFFG